MKVIWQIEQADIDRVNAFIVTWGDDPLVRERIRHNLSQEKPPVTRDDFWVSLVACLLTSQQRSGPDSPVSRLISLKPFPLSLSACCNCTNLTALAREVLTTHGGIRFAQERIPKFLQNNLPLVCGDGWPRLHEALEAVRRGGSVATEREAARLIDDTFYGVGPKQARNILQYMGLSQYEIPLDSRVAKWLNEFGFPIQATTALLGNPSYYEFVLDGIQQLCSSCDVRPTILDACIFASFDKGRWTVDNVVW